MKISSAAPNHYFKAFRLIDFYQTSSRPNVDFVHNTYSFVALAAIEKDAEVFHTYESLQRRESFDRLKTCNYP